LLQHGERVISSSLIVLTRRNFAELNLLASAEWAPAKLLIYGREELKTCSKMGFMKRFLLFGVL
jgi:hypothetical protein